MRIRSSVRPKVFGLLLTAAMAAASALPACAQETHRFDIGAADAKSALHEFGAQAGLEILAAGDNLQGKRFNRVSGELSTEDGLRVMLAGTGLTHQYVGGRAIALVKAQADGSPEKTTGIENAAQSGRSGQPAAEESESPGGVAHGAPDGEAVELEEIVVTGSHIRGAPVASPVIRLDQRAMRDAGQTSFLDVVRSIPQAFGGGQNFGVGINVGSAGIDMGGAVTINLRGLGSDATLTLLNGHRLAYNGSRQGIDVSAIPIGAVDRIEIVADGASALYGSDAVAGVANVVLKRDYAGVRLEAEGGVASEGGYSRQRYGATTGTRWDSGGMILSYEYARSTDLLSDERSFTRSRPGLIIYPPLERHAVVLAGHQALTDNLTFEADLLFNRRQTELGFPDNTAGDLAVSHTEQPSTSRSFAIAPSLKLDLSGGWQAAFSGAYGNERLCTVAKNFIGETLYRSTPLCYKNDGKSIELAADGPLFALAGGPARLALGLGYRSNLLNGDYGPATIPDIRGSQDSYYGYGELSLPLVSPQMDLAGIHRLDLSAALRQERYPGVDSVATPKLGLIYAPADGVELKASWGRSFRAPTLVQQYLVPALTLYPVERLGGAGYPAGSTALLLSGGNPAVQPERARTWTATIDIKPSWLAGARFQLSYFQTRYAERVVTPIALTAQSLSDAAYAALVTLAPSAAQSSSVIADAPRFTNSSGAPVDPANIVAIVDNRNRNAGSQSIHGVDMLADYRFAVGPGQLTASLNASYLQIRQQLGPGQPVLERTGLLFTPPDWRARAGLTWSGGPLTLNGSVNYTDGVDDTRAPATVRVRGTTTVDLTARYRLTGAGGPLGGLEFNLSLLNAFDDRPDEIASSFYFDTTYDSTNYSPLGRVIAFGVATSW